MDDENLNENEMNDEDSSLPDKNEGDNKSSISADLIRGHINTIILRTLYERDKYGYEIINEIEEKSHGQYTLKQPTLYSALKRLENQGYIKAYWKTDEVTLGGRRKYFMLTEAGKEITEKNQAEWEYSRTVIDNLISDRSFDFSQPAPTPVDFKLLKNSVSRVPLVKTEEEEKLGEEKVEEKTEQKVEEKILEEKAEKVEKPAEDVTQVTIDYATRPSATTTVEQSSFTYEERQSPPPQPAEPVEDKNAEEARRIAHENYIKLISQPAPPAPNPAENIAPHSDEIDTEKLIYNNKPETERDYKNLINGIFNRAIKTDQNRPKPAPQPRMENYSQPTPQFSAVRDKAQADGLKVNTSSYSKAANNATRTTFNLGWTLFKSSAIVAAILVFEFILCLCLRDNLHTGVGYSLTLLAIGLGQFIVFGCLFLSGFGSSSAKPMTNNYLSISIILTIICILIISVLAFLLNVNFNDAGDIMAKIVIPCLTTLNIPVFTVSFYFFIK